MKKGNFRGEVLQNVMPTKLDATDQKILYILSTNCRISNTAIANKLKMNRELVAYRIKQMLANDLITGFFTLIDTRKLGFFTHMIYVKLKALEDEKSIVDELVANDSVNAVLTFSGRYDLYFEVTTHTLEEFDHLFNSFMKRHSRSIQDFAILNLLKETFTGDNAVLEKHSESIVRGLEINESKGSSFQREFRQARKADEREEKVDSTDKKLLRLLHHDGRITLKDVADKAGLTPNGAKSRISRLVSRGVIGCFKPLISYSALGHQWYMVLLNLRGVDENRFYSYMRFHRNIEWCIRSIGPWNYQVSIYARDNKEFHNVLNEIRSEFSDNLLSFDSVLVFNQFKFEQRVD